MAEFNGKTAIQALLQHPSNGFMAWLDDEALAKLHMTSKVLSTTIETSPYWKLHAHQVTHAIATELKYVQEHPLVHKRAPVRPSMVMNIGHRGVKEDGLQPNTIPAFRRALQLGADVIELDV